MPASAKPETQTPQTKFPETKPHPARFIGCDVGKTSIVVFDSRDASTRTVANKPEPLAAFAAGLDDTCLVVCEATGGY